MSERVGIAGDQLRAIVERIEHIEDEIKELTEAKKDIYQEAKGNGFDVKILREVIRLRKQDQKERDEQESLGARPGPFLWVGSANTHVCAPARSPGTHVAI